MKRVQVGMLVTIIGNTSGHLIPTGTRARILEVASNGNFRLENQPHYWVAPADVEPASWTKEELLKERQELSSKLEDVSIRLQWMEENQASEIDEQEYKIFRALEIVQKTGDRLTAARQLARLFFEDSGV